MKSHKRLFTKSLAAIPAHLHACAHSHHLRPDCVLDAQIACAEDAFTLADKKWDKIFSDIYPQAQKHISSLLSTSHPENIIFGTNIHEFILRLLSCFQGPVHILTTNSEFHSAFRQFRRLEEEGLAVITRIAAEPFETFPARFLKATRKSYDLIFLSHVFFNSGYTVPDLKAIADSVDNKDTFIVIDGYHSIMAMPVDIADIQNRVFFLGGGYKYVMAGEGVCFMHAPPGYGPRPANTGWYAGFEFLEDAGEDGNIIYPTNAQRFAGSTFDPSGLYRLNAVMEMIHKENISPAAIHERAMALQSLFLEKTGNFLPLVNPGAALRGNFLTFRTEQAPEIQQKLMTSGLFTDCRGDRLRFGFGIYHDADDIEQMAGIVSSVF